MPALGLSRHLRCWVLVSFLLALGLASAAPLLHPLRWAQICSSVHGWTALGTDQGDLGQASADGGIQCSLCLPPGLTPTLSSMRLCDVSPGEILPAPLMDVAVLDTVHAVPPARGPPFP